MPSHEPISCHHIELFLWKCLLSIKRIRAGGANAASETVCCDDFRRAFDFVSNSFSPLNFRMAERTCRVIHRKHLDLDVGLQTLVLTSTKCVKLMSFSESLDIHCCCCQAPYSLDIQRTFSRLTIYVKNLL